MIVRVCMDVKPQLRVLAENMEFRKINKISWSTTLRKSKVVIKILRETRAYLVYEYLITMEKNDQGILSPKKSYKDSMMGSSNRDE